ncbi:fucose permease [Paenibacillus forsythiae]|uniref:Fucose permease n=1 Tax=Paenibacillus forsythiae TaxID=365616 RepID=A0ABU3HC33_9BACL|nr:MFS transporter [Paenibacillus forsythiae]MDT3427245.1 fucose permease [Paenibacillus forsythiae]
MNTTLENTTTATPSPGASPKRIYTLQLLTVFIGFLIFGFSENIKGPAIPRIQLELGLKERQIGTLLSLNSLGYLLACSFTAHLIRKIGIKAVCLLAFGSMVLSGILIFLSRSYPELSGSFFLMYIGNGMLEIGLAVLGARIFIRNTGMMMNLAHFFYGLSSAVAPIMASGLMTLAVGGRAIDWREVYLLILLLAVLPMIPAIAGKFPDGGHSDEDRIPLRTIAADPVIWMLIAILSFGVISEMAVGGWLVNFLEKAYGWDGTAAAGMLSVFFICFTFARLFLGPVTDKIGFTLSVIIFSALSGLLTFAGIAAGEPGAFLFAAAGIGIAPIYPTVMALIAQRYRRGGDTAITFIVTLMGVSSVIGNYLIGAIISGIKNIVAASRGAEDGLLLGLQAGYMFIGLCALLCSLSAIPLYRYLKKRGELL